MRKSYFRLARSLAGVLAGCSLASVALADGFTGPLASDRFTTLNTGAWNGTAVTLGSAVFTPTQLTLTGGNSISPNPANLVSGCAGGIYATLASPCEVRTTIAQPGLYSFSWSYTTADDAGPAGDIFGVIVDGVHIALSSPGGAVTQGGSASFRANSVFGWFMNCTDCINGAATAVIGNASVVPEPGSLALWMAGAAGVAGALRVSRRASKNSSGSAR